MARSSRGVGLLVLALVGAMASCGVEAREEVVPPPVTAPSATTTTEAGGTGGSTGGGDETTTTDPDDGGTDDPTTTTEPDDGGGGGGGTGDRSGLDEDEEAEVLAALEGDCVDGDDRACDLLFLASPPGSDLEDTGSTCAGRTGAGLFCAEETQFPGASSDDSPGLEVLAGDCREGDMVACDLLYEISPIDSDYEDLGLRCGDEDAEPAMPSCRVANG